jgi:hypothetical protein
MNLSCGNCKTIRSFSGQPPACDECGWVYLKPYVKPFVKLSDVNPTSVQNLYCDKCETTRPFFGTAPACYECGWVYGSETSAIKDIAETAGTGLALLGVLASILIAVVGTILLIWAAISAVRWFWDNPLW